jgi:uroporphyrinogen-III synthase
MPRPTLAGSYVISLRPRGQHAALRRAAARFGARVLSLSPVRIDMRDDATTRSHLHEALASPIVVFTSPNAVRAARALQPLRARRGQAWLAVGEGTAAALRRAGIATPVAPARMDSAGLLELPQLQAVDGRRVGLVTAPGGRGRIAPALEERGASVLRANVYERVAVAPRADAIARLRTLRAPWLLLSSGEALEQLLAVLPADAARHLRRARVVAASARLATLARRLGFAPVAIAASARPRDLLDAVARAASR